MRTIFHICVALSISLFSLHSCKPFAAESAPSANTWVFILAGQSNMAGRARIEPGDTATSSRIMTIDLTGQMIRAKEPLHFYEPGRSGLGCGMSFARELLKHVPDSINILLVPAAVGGTSISQWIGDSVCHNVQLFSNFSKKMEAAKRYGTLKGILWHQGETDAIRGNGISVYAQELKTLFMMFRRQAQDRELPIIAGQIGSFVPNSALLNNQISQYVLSDKFTHAISTSGLTHTGDFLHFNTESQREMGRRYALVYATLNGNE